MSFVYVASPYTHAEVGVRSERCALAAMYTASLMLQGVPAFSPIVHGHHLSGLGLPLDHDFWMAQCLPMVRMAKEIHALKIDGWNDSKGMRAEIVAAKACLIPVLFIEQNAVGVWQRTSP